MPNPHLSKPSFPNVCIHKDVGGMYIEVHLIAEVGRGRGNAMVQQAADLQQRHPRFVDALDEPSTCIGELMQSDVDHSSLYTFLVESQGHPFHRHASPRMFTAVSGGDGTQLRFSTAKHNENELNLEAFFEQAYCIQIPADSLFTVRFSRGVWHQFVPAKVNSTCPALFAVSFHPDDMHGIQDQHLRNRILGGEASIPMLTEVLPEQLSRLVSEHDFAARCDNVQQLQLHQANSVSRHTRGTSHRTLPNFLYQKLFSRLHHHYMSYTNQVKGSLFSRTRQGTVPSYSLVWDQLVEKASFHLDHFELVIHHQELRSFSMPNATAYMSDLLQAFIKDSPAGVTCLMQVRNALVKPFGLRTSNVGCPVSSLMSDQAQEYFLNRFPVWAYQVNENNTIAQVVLGADDKHLQFRSVVMVEVREEGIAISLSNRVAYRNLFGRFYMRCIRGIHQTYIVPKMLSTAASKLCLQESQKHAPGCWCMRLLWR
ncbi:DUF2867 domain-containing protein [Undibacterium sp. LX40W]|uniref:DUF2867 domain-containing protein n=1 Tax=Undibacterium nitidum TaxID=2762298 RepID=A0A923HIP5_9BURK|nr:MULTISPECIES: DUF2867 domain-containing protein [Undibacterium]MBC3880465.1 DUF2867 domain-containing protein [Undibacterium nitidum]MBC3890799.1 DUF2867 domain-containing protein [Undibacterium sp. LX40W]